MAFRSIGTLASAVLAEVEKQRAAVQSAHEFGGDGQDPREVTARPSPMLSAGGGTHASNEVPVYIAPRTGKRAAGAAEDGSRLRTETGKADGKLASRPSELREGVVTTRSGKAPTKPGSASLSTMPRSKVIASPNGRTPRLSAIIFDLDIERAKRHLTQPNRLRWLRSTRAL